MRLVWGEVQIGREDFYWEWCLCGGSADSKLFWWEKRTAKMNYGVRVSE